MLYYTLQIYFIVESIVNIQDEGDGGTLISSSEGKKYVKQHLSNVPPFT